MLGYVLVFIGLLIVSWIVMAIVLAIVAPSRPVLLAMYAIVFSFFILFGVVPVGVSYYATPTVLAEIEARWWPDTSEEQPPD
ncbi:MAG: hypothetical protein KTR31_34535 [Myxococcales bacterium]|nr:hypothetical protein [Myxococcales bacterium]